MSVREKPMIAMTMQPVPTSMARMTAHVLEDTWEMEHSVNVSTCMCTLMHVAKVLFLISYVWLLAQNTVKLKIFISSLAIVHCGSEDNCSRYAICTDTDTGFVCECLAGYAGDGVNCCKCYSM